MSKKLKENLVSKEENSLNEENLTNQDGRPVSKARIATKRLAFCGICIALASVAAMFTIFRFPFGGEITCCSMLLIVIPAWLYGLREGSLCGLVYGLILFALNPYIISVPQFILDYILAFSVMGIAGLFKNSNNGLIKGYIAAIVARWAIATCAGLAWIAAGYTAWDGWNPIPYSMAYNAAYIFAEGGLTLIILAIPAVRKALNYVKREAA